MAYDEGDTRTTRGLISDNADSRTTQGIVHTIFVAIKEVVEKVVSTTKIAGKRIEEQFWKFMFYIQFMGQKIFKTYDIDIRHFKNIQVFANIEDMKQLEEQIKNININSKLISCDIIEEKIDIDGKVK